MVEKQLLEENDILEDLEDLPFYPMESLDRYSWNLYSNSYYIWFNKCDSVGGQT